MSSVPLSSPHPQCPVSKYSRASCPCQLLQRKSWTILEVMYRRPVITNSISQVLRANTGSLSPTLPPLSCPKHKHNTIESTDCTDVHKTTLICFLQENMAVTVEKVAQVDVYCGRLGSPGRASLCLGKAPHPGGWLCKWNTIQNRYNIYLLPIGWKGIRKSIVIVTCMYSLKLYEMTW